MMKIKEQDIQTLLDLPDDKFNKTMKDYLEMLRDTSHDTYLPESIPTLEHTVKEMMFILSLQ